MKNLLLLILFVFTLTCCNTERKIDREIEGKITEFYKTVSAKDYDPVSYSKLDTIQFIPSLDGSISRLMGTVAHEYWARSKNGQVMFQTDTFDVTIFKDEVIAIPRGY